MHSMTIRSVLQLSILRESRLRSDLDGMVWYGLGLRPYHTINF